MCRFNQPKVTPHVTGWGGEKVIAINFFTFQQKLHTTDLSRLHCEKRLPLIFTWVWFVSTLLQFTHWSGTTLFSCWHCHCNPYFSDREFWFVSRSRVQGPVQGMAIMSSLHEPLLLLLHEYFFLWQSWLPFIGLWKLGKNQPPCQWLVHFALMSLDYAFPTSAPPAAYFKL